MGDSIPRQLLLFDYLSLITHDEVNKITTRKTHSPPLLLPTTRQMAQQLHRPSLQSEIWLWCEKQPKKGKRMKKNKSFAHANSAGLKTNTPSAITVPSVRLILLYLLSSSKTPQLTLLLLLSSKGFYYAYNYNHDRVLRSDIEPIINYSTSANTVEHPRTFIIIRNLKARR